MTLTNTYIFLDAARMDHLIQTAKELNPSFDSLYRGRSEEDLEAVAPFLFSFPGNDAFASWVYEEGWGDAWGVVVETEKGFEECWKHFRKFLLVKTEDGEELYFRFYDPRVLKIFLPTCDESQLMEFFGPVEAFIVEGEDKETSIRFSLANGHLQQTTVSTAGIFGKATAGAEAAAPPAAGRKRSIIGDDVREHNK